MNRDVLKIADLAREAGRVIMEIYARKEIEVTIEEGCPVWGVVHAPVPEALYYASKEGGAWKRIQEETPVRIRVRPLPDGGLVAVASRAHASEGDAGLLNRLPAGGVVLDPNGAPLRYNKPTLKNDGFIAHSGQIDLG